VDGSAPVQDAERLPQGRGNPKILPVELGRCCALPSPEWSRTCKAFSPKGDPDHLDGGTT